MGAWNIDYERDSEEVIYLKKHIAEQGWERLFSSLFSLIHSYLPLRQSQLYSTGAVIEDKGRLGR